MTPAEATSVFGRINAIWPTSHEVDKAEVREWVDFLLPFDLTTAKAALAELQKTMRFRPAMADFRSAYLTASLTAAPDRKALPGRAEAGTAERNRELYGRDPDDWVYCWKCDQAITLEERSTNPHYREGRGLFHARCPRRGSAPTIPNRERLIRDEHYRKTHGGDQ